MRRSHWACCAAVAAAVLGCTMSRNHPPAVVDSVKLAIPDRPWDPNRPNRRVGWCAEACIQMAMAYYGREVSQKAINRAGRPSHPDMYMGDIDGALDALGVTYAKWDEANPNLDDYFAWIKECLRAGHPVICGIKIYPDEHPAWFLDHFVLAVGFDSTGLVLNTNMDGQRHLTYRRLSALDKGYSFASAYRHYYARAITGLSAGGAPGGGN